MRVLGILVLFVQLLVSVAIFTDEALSYVNTLMFKYSGGDTLSREEFAELYQSLKLEVREDLDPDKNFDDVWCDKILNSTFDRPCPQCVGGKDVFSMYAVDSQLNSTTLLRALPALVMSLEEEQCIERRMNVSEVGAWARDPTTVEVWSYSLGVVFAVIGLSNLGALLSPFMKSPFFQKILMFLVAVAIGTQAGAGIVVLIPESMHLMFIEETRDVYLWKTCSVLGGMIFVLTLERILKIAFHHKKSIKERTLAEISVEAGSTVTLDTTVCNGVLVEDTKSPSVTMSIINGAAVSDKLDLNAKPDLKMDLKDPQKDKPKVKQQIATVAWMVMLGDAIHKTVDGLSVGAAFTENTTTGLTLAISILCEELPHELGDISILLHSGMTMKQALFYNTLAAAMGIPGAIVGIFLGETTSANQWIFAIAGGIFVYVPLAAMLPEMSHTIDKALVDGTGAILMSILQLVGLCLGFGIIVLVAAYAGEISI